MTGDVCKKRSLVSHAKEEIWIDSLFFCCLFVFDRSGETDIVVGRESGGKLAKMSQVLIDLMVRAWLNSICIQEGRWPDKAGKVGCRAERG